MHRLIIQSYESWDISFIVAVFLLRFFGGILELQT